MTSPVVAQNLINDILLVIAVLICYNLANLKVESNQFLFTFQPLAESKHTSHVPDLTKLGNLIQVPIVIPSLVKIVFTPSPS